MNNLVGTYFTKVIFGTNKINRLQRAIIYQTNEQYKLFEMKYGITKLSKYNQVKLVLGDFGSVLFVAN